MPDISPQDRDLVARTVLSEAQNDGESGMAAVANVIKNRADSGRYGETPGAVVLQRKQFEPWSLPQGDSNHPSRWSAKSPDYQRAASIVDSVWKGDVPDVTGGATHFYSPRDQAALGRKAPEWAAGKPIATVGHHAFYAPEGAVPPDLLGSWGAPAPTGTASTPAVAEPDDLLGSWNAGAPAQSGRQPLRLTVTKPPPSAPSNETMPEFFNRELAEHQGNTLTDKAVRLGVGVGRGMGDVGDTLAQGVTAAGTGTAGALEHLGVIAPETAAGIRQWGAGVNQDIHRQQSEFDQGAAENPLAQVGRLTGQVIGSGPLASRAAVTIAGRPVVSALATGALGGGVAAGLTSSTSNEPLASQVAEGAVTGGAMGPLGYGASALGRGIRNTLFGHIDPATARLALDARQTYGIPVTAGQMSNTPFVQVADSVLKRLPFTGYAGRTEAQLAGVNRSVAETFGEHTEAITPDVIRDAKVRIGHDFEDVARRTGPIAVDTPFARDLHRITSDANSVLPQSELQPLQRQVQNIIDVVDPHTRTISPESYQALTRRGAPLDRAMQSSDPNVRHYAGQLREAIDDMMERSAPRDVVDDLRRARSQWRAMKTIEPVADKAGPNGISPTLLRGAINKGYPGTTRAPGAAETALRDVSQISQRFIREQPNSGTPERLLALHLGGLALGGVGAATFDPEHVQRDIAIGALGLGAGRAASSALRSHWLANAMIRSPLPPNAGALTALTRRTAPLAALTFRDRFAGE